MVHLVGVSAVFVPFEKVKDRWVKRDDLPRFLRDRDVSAYIRSNPDISWREHEGRRWPVCIEWREHSEKDLIQEYARGVGTPDFNRRQKRHPWKFGGRRHG